MTSPAVVDLTTKKVASLGDTTPAGNFDGVEPDGKGGYLVTDWASGGLFQVAKDGKPTRLLPLAKGSADLGVGPDGIRRFRQGLSCHDQAVDATISVSLPDQNYSTTPPNLSHIVTQVSAKGCPGWGATPGVPCPVICDFPSRL